MIYARKTTATRQRVTDRLIAAASYPISVVIAPAGFGKTTAVRDLLGKFETAIYIATPQAATLGQFIQVFARACSRHFPEMSTPPRDSTSGSQNAEGTIDLYAAWALFHLREATCTIAIDDLQYADGDRSVAKFLSHLADALKQQIRWIFCSRNRGHLPLTRWQAYGDADAPITADDLRMNLDEATTLASSLQSPANAEQIATWVEQTRGFPVPLAYAIRLSARRGTVESIMDGTRAVTFRFLAEQLWTTLSSDERRLLEVAAFLPAVHMHALDRGGITNASALISKLCDDIAFLDLTIAGMFSMHDLFRNFIKQMLSISGPTCERDRLDSAVNVLLVSGYLNEGYTLLLTYSNSLSVADAIERFPTTTCDLNVTRQLAEATLFIQPDRLGLRCLYLQAEHWAWVGNTHRARGCANEIIRRSDSTSTQILCAIRSMFRIVNLQSPEEHQQWLATLPPTFGRLSDIDLIQARAYQASLLARYTGSNESARSLVRHVQAGLHRLEPLARVDALVAVAGALYYLKEHDTALGLICEAATVALSEANAVEIARTLNNYGLLLYRNYDPEIATLFEPLHDAVERTGSWRFAHVSHWLPAQYYALQGDIDAALTARKSQVPIFIEEDEKRRYSIIQRHTANLCNILRDDFSTIISDFTKMGLPKQNESAYELLTDVAAAYAFSSDFAACEKALLRLKHLRASLLPEERQYARDALFVEIIVTCVVGRWAQAKRLNEQLRDNIPNLAPLEEALALFCQGPPFLAARTAIEGCLHKPFIGFAAHLMKRVMERQLLHYSTHPLSGAEIEVLRLLVIGKSNKDIATARSRSAETVKRQVASVYRKLGVENRTSAVAIARERGLL